MTMDCTHDVAPTLDVRYDMSHVVGALAPTVGQYDPGKHGHGYDELEGQKKPAAIGIQHKTNETRNT